MKYYVNKETGRLLDRLQMEKEWAVVYDGFDEIHSRCKSDIYEEVVRVECQDKA